jgi:hypothetical protein
MGIIVLNIKSVKRLLDHSFCHGHGVVTLFSHIYCVYSVSLCLITSRMVRFKKLNV